jgi:hypothetical protein
LPVRWRNRPKKRPAKTRPNMKAQPNPARMSSGLRETTIAVGDDEEGQGHSDHRLSPDDGDSPS